MNDITIEQRISFSMIEDLLISAFEGGSNYWYRIEKKIEPSNWEYWGEYNETRKKYLQLYPLNGGSLEISDYHIEGDDEGGKIQTKILDMSAIKKGMQEMANNKDTIHHYADILKENTDAITGDVFLQYCLFGEVLYS